MISQPQGNIHVLNAVGVYLFKVNCEYDRRNCGISSKLTIKTLERSQLTPFNQTQRQPPQAFYKRAALKNFIKKHNFIKNISPKKRKETQSQKKFLITIADLQFKQITIQEDHNIHTYFVQLLQLQKSLVIFSVQKPGLSIFLFLTKEQKRKKEKKKKSTHFSSI